MSYLTDDSREMMDITTVAQRTRMRLPALPSSPVFSVPPLVARNESFDVTVERCDAVVRDPFHLFSSTRYQDQSHSVPVI